MKYRFEYIRGAEEAASKGFQPFVAFPSSKKSCGASLAAVLSQPGHASSRPDYLSYLAQLGLEPPAEELAILARSGGQRTTERDEIEVFAPPLKREDGTYETHSSFAEFGTSARRTSMSPGCESANGCCVCSTAERGQPRRGDSANRQAGAADPARLRSDHLCHDVATLLKV